MEKLKRQLAEAEAELEARKKPPEDTGPRIVGEGLVIDEWVNRQFLVVGSWSIISTSSFDLFLMLFSCCCGHFLRRKEGKDTLLGNRLKGSLILCKVPSAVFVSVLFTPVRCHFSTFF